MFISNFSRFGNPLNCGSSQLNLRVQASQRDQIGKREVIISNSNFHE